MGNRDFKERLYSEFARIGKALANPHRLELLDLLAQGPRSVEDLAMESGLTLANASQHLQVLRSAQLVESRRDGLHVYYRLPDDSVIHLWHAVRAVGESRLAEVDRVVNTFLHDRSDLDALDANTVLQRLGEDGAVVLDVRPSVEYRAGHIAGAQSIPIDELELRLDELPINGEIIAYCRGPYCVYADEAVALLRERGFNAKRFDLGYPDWKVAGLPVASTEEGRSR